jgi:Pectinacetylesterase
MKFGCLLSLAAVSAVIACGSSNNNPAAPAGDGGADDANMTPITGLAPNDWTWVPVAGTHCRDGSDTGIAVNLASPASDKIVVYLEGGGACVDEFFCSPIATPEKFGATEFTAWKAGTGAATAPNGGIFSRTDAANPVAGWNYVYVPYCTGDVFVGDNPKGMVPNVAAVQQFVGYTDMHLDLDRIVPTFPGTTKVLLTGISAGGFGASANYVQTARAFGSTPVYLLDDSGPPFEAPYLANCMQTQFASLWGMTGALADCGNDCTNPNSYFIDYSKHLAKTYPTMPFGLIESTEDAVISLFFGYGNPGNCVGSSFPTSSLPGPTFTAGLADAQMQLAGASNFGSFIFTGGQHTSIGASGTFDQGVTNVPASLLAPAPDTDSGAVDSGAIVDSGTILDGGPMLDGATIADGGATPEAGAAPATIKLTDWIATLVNEGKVSNVGP